TQLFARVRRALVQARAALPDAPPPGPRAISRRAALAMLAAAAACTPRSATAASGDGPVAIVGGGTSGLVVAWRLANAGRSAEIFESSGRTGGRMFTLRNFTPEGHFCELGGELVDSNHTALIDICKELGLAIQRLRPEGDLATDVFDIGGKQYTVNDLLDPAAQTGAFIPVAQKIAADQAALLDAQENWTPRALELDAMPLSRYLDGLKETAEPWVVSLLALAYHGEYGIPLEEQSSLNLVDFIGIDTSAEYAMFGDSDESHRIAGGSSTLPETLTQRLSAAPLSSRTAINLRHELTEIARDGDGIRLSFKGGDGAPTEKSFERVVLALPFTRLREVKGVDTLGLTPEKMKAITELGYGVNSKLMVGTSSRPWAGSLMGINTPLSGSIYSDRGIQIVWDTSAGQEGKGGVITNFLTGDLALAEEAAALANLQNGLRSLSPELATALTPNVRASFFWPLHPHTKASYAGCKTGQYTSHIEFAAQSELDGRLLFAGEHTSANFIGFMNGAVDAGERVAKELLATV
ncbi:MAG TPA: NAD(P)/FAD-dependent oxidoreductase, partial [Hyphomonadaceae bacterium]|nr:NAD(P)/FAD-dependent oxidoreductase [Hyphomonadaceae bacterium]